ncbi:MAG: hypothetical protein D6723_19715 [Acidobacteria bacterium]|nr:MAG: hypothetical protein D6723_19715 [Acidobacteriota bacterium]
MPRSWLSRRRRASSLSLSEERSSDTWTPLACERRSSKHCCLVAVHWPLAFALGWPRAGESREAKPISQNPSPPPKAWSPPRAPYPENIRMSDTSWGEKVKLIIWIFLDGLERFFTQNKLLKLLSLALAFLIWFTVSTQEQGDRLLQDVPLRVLHSPTTIITNVVPKAVNVRVRGPLAVVNDLDPEGIEVIVDVSELDPGNYVIGPEEVHHIPSTVEVRQIDPPYIPINLERKIVRDLPVSPQIVAGQLPSDRVIIGSTVEPSTVQLAGPESKVNRIEHLVTERIVIPENAASQHTFLVNVVPPGQHMTITPARVKVTVTIDEVVEKRLDHLTPKRPPRVRIPSGTSLSVTLRGPRTFLDKIGPDDIIVSVNVAGLSRGEHEVTPSIALPDEFRDWVQVIAIEPPSLTVRVR